jgi:hypothetical protein
LEVDELLGDIRKQLKEVRPGDLIEVQWYDASVGKSLNQSKNIDIPVRSWGIFIGLLGEKTKHVVIAQNRFRYSEGVFDMDYTAIPVSWASEIKIVQKQCMPADVVKGLLRSFAWSGRRTTFRPKAQHNDRRS